MSALTAKDFPGEDGREPGAPPGPASNASGKAKRYQRARLRLTLFGMALELAALLFLLLSGGSVALRQLVVRQADWPPLQILYYFVLLGLAWEALTGPLDYARGYWLEHRYGLSNQTLRAWLWDEVKSLLVSGVLGLAVVELVYGLLRAAGSNWWWIAALCLVLLMVVLARLTPVVLLPLFYKTRPLDRPQLKQRLLALAERCGASVVDVFQLDLSAKSKAANAALAGWGRTRRILLGDTLLSGYEEEEIEAVLAHELGHHHFAHLWKLMALQSGIFFLGFYLADRFLAWGVGRFGFEGPGDPAAFPLLALAFAALALVLLPLANGLSRRYERQADRFAAEATRGPGALISALRKLSRQNLADPNPHPVVELLFYSHPSIARRITSLEQLEAASPDDEPMGTLN